MATLESVEAVLVMDLVVIFVFIVLISKYTDKFRQQKSNPIMAHRVPAFVICLNVNIVLGRYYCTICRK